MMDDKYAYPTFSKFLQTLSESIQEEPPHVQEDKPGGRMHSQIAVTRKRKIENRKQKPVHVTEIS